MGTSLRIACLSCCVFAASPAAGWSVAGSPAPASAVADSASSRPVDAWSGRDKYSHLTASAFLTAGQVFLYRERAGWRPGKALSVAATSTLILGLGKEAYDRLSGRGRASLRDMAADLAGIGVAALVLGGK